MSLLSSFLGRFSPTPRDVPDSSTLSYLFNAYAKQFGVHCAESYVMLRAVSTYNAAYQNTPTQMMKVVCKEAAKLALTDYKVELTDTQGSQQITNTVLSSVSRLLRQLPQYLECGIALGGLIFKPSQFGISIISPLNFVPISYSSTGDITSVIFIEYARKGEMKYTKLEYHHWIGTDYCIDTKVFKTRNEYELGFATDLAEVAEWAGIQQQVTIPNLTVPLFSYFRMPGANNVDETSPLGISLCASALEYLHTFEHTFNAFKADIETTRKVVFVNNAALINVNKRQSITGKEPPASFTHNPIPNLIVGINGDSQSIAEFNPSNNFEAFKSALQVLLNLIAAACGFSTDHWAFDVRRGVVTATAIEADQEETVSTITSIRNSLNTAVEGAIISLVNFLSLYSHEQFTYKLTFYARDLTATPYADRERILQLVREGLYPLRKYLIEYEGLPAAEADSFISTQGTPEPNVKKIDVGTGSIE